MPIKQGKRRFAVFDINPEKRGDADYFNNLVRELNDDEVNWAFYQYLKTMNTYKTPMEFQKNIPATKAYLDVRILNAPLYQKWLVYCLKTGTLKDGSTSELYSKFVKWVEQNREGSIDTIPTQTSFGLMLSNAKDCLDYTITENIGEKIKTRTVMMMKWNLEGLIKGLQNIYLLDADFQYVETILNGQCRVQSDYEEEIVYEEI